MSDDATILGRAEIAHRLGRSERTVSRWIAQGILPVRKSGPFANNLLAIRTHDLEQFRRRNNLDEAS